MAPGIEALMHPQRTEFPLIDDAFGHWLAGFVDGEGCFCIVNNGRLRMCSFSIALRADDRPILAEIQHRTGVGGLYDCQGRGTTKPYARWTVQRQSHASAIADLFTRFPLRGKKARDFAIWKDAVAVLRTGGQGRPNPERWAMLDALKAELQEGRVFVSHDQTAAVSRSLVGVESCEGRSRSADPLVLFALED